MTVELIFFLILPSLKNFCDNNRHRYPVEPQFPCTVGPTEFVIAFFKEFVLKRTYMKSVSIETDVRTQIGLRAEDNEDEEGQLTLLQSNFILHKTKRTSI
jgi:hypothetical protein